MKFILTVALILIQSIGFSQKEEALLYRTVENFIVEGELDSARTEIHKHREIRNEYVFILSELANESKLSNEQYYQFFQQISEHSKVDHIKSYQLFLDLIPMPKSKQFDYYYAQICWSQAQRLCNETELDKANKVQDLLETYVSRFDPTIKDVRRAKILINNYKSVLKIIEADSTGIDFNKKNEQAALALNDTNLIILTLFSRCDFLVMSGKLDEYIEISKYCYLLDKSRAERSPQYYGNLIHLIDALIYKGDQDAFVMELLQEFYESENRELSYSLFAKFLRFSEPNSSNSAFVFELFGANDITHFCDTTLEMAEDILNPNDYFHLVNESAYALVNFGEYKYGINYMQKGITVTRKIYSHNLSRSLANYQSDLIRKEKDLELQKKGLELEYQKGEVRYRAIIIGLMILLILLGLIAFVRKMQQSKVLKKSNLHIEEQRKLLEKSLGEKQLLLKEIHHRVKNNFQMVSSLLQLQMRDIKDEKAREISEDGQNRIRSMAILHQKLYENEEITIDFENYVMQLVTEINNIYATSTVSCNYQLEKGVTFDMDTIIPLGLILNELITNSFKYAFESTRNNELSIELRRERTSFLLVVKDNGAGLPESVDWQKANSLGLRLVRRLSSQLKGHTDYALNKGAEFTVKFNHIRDKTNP